MTLSDIMIAIGSLVGGVLLAFLLAPAISVRVELRKAYLAPFGEWCSRSYGEFMEFSRRYVRTHPSGVGRHGAAKVSDLHLMLDFWELHEKLAHAPQWLGRIERENREVALDFWELIDSVDTCWHRLQNNYKYLPATADPKAFEETTKRNVRSEDQSQIADTIRHFLRSSKATLSEERFDRILAYLASKVPGRRTDR